MELKPKTETSLKCISLADLADALGYGPWTIKRWMAQGQFPKPLSLTDAGQYRWRVRDIEAFLEKRKLRRRRPVHKGVMKRRMQRGGSDAR